MKRELTKNITLSAMFLAIGFVLPFFTGQIKQIGNMLLPMHIPVLLCGLICGWKYGACIGFILPLMRSAIFGMPVLFPNAVSMALELAAYGLVVGIVYGVSKWKCVIALYRALIIAMITGRRRTALFPRDHRKRFYMESIYIRRCSECNPRYHYSAYSDTCHHDSA